ncbi:MAG: hypothetical protein WC956_08580 [bacterium]
MHIRTIHIGIGYIKRPVLCLREEERACEHLHARFVFHPEEHAHFKLSEGICAVEAS